MLPVPPTVVFPVGVASTACFYVTIVDDNELEGDHDFTVEITGISSGSPHAMVDAASTTTITITDDDGE